MNPALAHRTELQTGIRRLSLVQFDRQLALLQAHSVPCPKAAELPNPSLRMCAVVGESGHQHLQFYTLAAAAEDNVVLPRQTRSVCVESAGA